MADHDTIAAMAYAAGQDPIDHACERLSLLIGSVRDISAAREVDPRAYPIYQLPLDDDTVARQAIGLLLDCGWTPPTPAHPHRTEGDPP